MSPKKPFRHQPARHLIILGIAATFIFTLLPQLAHAAELPTLKKFKSTLSEEEKAKLEKVQKEYDDMACIVQQIGKESVVLKLKRDKAKKANDTKQAEKLSKKIQELDAEARAAMQKHMELKRALKRLSDSKKEKNELETLQKKRKDLADLVEKMGREGAATRLKIYAAQGTKNQKQIEELSQKVQELTDKIRAANRQRMKIEREILEIRGLLTPQKEKTELEKIQEDYGNTTCVVLQLGRELMESKRELGKAEEAKDTKKAEKLSKVIQKIDELYRDRIQKCRDLEKELDRLSTLPKEAAPKEKTELEKIQSDYQDTICSIQATARESMDLRLKLDEATKTKDTQQAEKLSEKLQKTDAEALLALQKYVKLKRDLRRLPKSKETMRKAFQEENLEHNAVVYKLILLMRRDLSTDLIKARKAKDIQQAEKLRKKTQEIHEVIEELHQLYH